MKTVKYVGVSGAVEFQDDQGRWYECKRGETVEVPDELVDGVPANGKPFGKDGEPNPDFNPGRQGLTAGDFELVEHPKPKSEPSKREERV